MTTLAEYGERYETMRMRREDGILEVMFHSANGPLQWGAVSHEEFPLAFHDIANDLENRVVILTGTGDEWSGPQASPETFPRNNVRGWETIRAHGIQLLENLLSIPVPVISAINGPVRRHAEIPLLADVVIAAPTASFQDSAHLLNRLTPGDGIGIAMLYLLGLNRGRYFLLTGQRLDAAHALQLGLVSEVVPSAELLPRAWELARQIANNNDLVLRYTKLIITQQLRRDFHDLLGYGLALEGLAVVDVTDEG